MAASTDKSTTTRRRRYARIADRTPVTLTPAKVALLRYLGVLGIASSHQLAALACPSAKSGRRHLRQLFDAGLVEVIGASRVMLASPELANDERLLYGSAPNLFTLTRAGQRALTEREISLASKPTAMGPKNSLFLGHHLAVNDVYIWLTLTARAHPGHRLGTWDNSCRGLNEASSQVPQIYPDAWFTYHLGKRTLVAFVEADRSTERGSRRLRQKLAGYQVLYRGDGIRSLTGYQNARILFLVPSEARRVHLAGQIAKYAPAALAEVCYLAEMSVLAAASLTTPAWQRPGHSELFPLVSPDLI